MALTLKKSALPSATHVPSSIPPEPIMAAPAAPGNYGLAAICALVATLAFGALLVVQLIEVFS